MSKSSGGAIPANISCYCILEFPSGFVDLLHEAVFLEVLHEALVAVEDGSDVFVAGFELHHGVGEDTAECLHLTLLLDTLVVNRTCDQERHQDDGETDEVARAEQATGVAQGFGFLVGDFVRNVVLRRCEVR